MVFEKICEILADQLGVDAESITRETHIINDLGADSLDVVEMVTTLEDEYGISILDDYLREHLTVGEVVDFVESKI